MSEKREWWIGISKTDKGIYREVVTTDWGNYLHQFDEAIHVIEKSAYDKLEAEVKELRAENQKLKNDWLGLNKYTIKLIVMAERLKEALDLSMIRIGLHQLPDEYVFANAKQALADFKAFKREHKG